MEQFAKTANRCGTEAEESEFQTSVPCANLIKMKTHFQFILMNWNITSLKMVRKNIYLRDKQFKRNIQVMVQEIAP